VPTSSPPSHLRLVPPVLNEAGSRVEARHARLGLSARVRGKGPRSDRFFRDIHGTEWLGTQAIVFGRARSAAGDHDVPQDHSAVVCAGPRRARTR